jgi:hypothetical protein
LHEKAKVVWFGRRQDDFHHEVGLSAPSLLPFVRVAGRYLVAESLCGALGKRQRPD